MLFSDREEVLSSNIHRMGFHTRKWQHGLSVTDPLQRGVNVAGKSSMLSKMVKYDRVTVHFKDEKEPMVVRHVSKIARSHFPGSQEPALQIIDVPFRPTTGSLMGEKFFDLELNLARPSEIDYLVLQEGDEERVVHLEDLFDQWDWRSS